MLCIKSITDIIKNYPGFRTTRKILVIESDDWGSNRMPSKEIFEILKAKGITHDENRYDKYDTLAGYEDLSAIFEVLNSVKDRNGNPAKMTAVSVVANPDFKKIRESDFKEYHYKLFTDTLERRNESNVINLWKQGIKGGYFIPEFHGREHLNVSRWMKALKDGHELTHIAFENGVYGITLESQLKQGDSYLAAYDFYDPSELADLKKITIDGLNQFEKVFGFRSSYFVPPNGPLSSNLHETLADSGINALQTARFIYSEPVGYGKFRKRLRYLGMKNKVGQIYTLRNVFFEPNHKLNVDWVDKCLNEIAIAFSCNKPAIISSHRVNFIGTLVLGNRIRSLKLFKQLLLKIKNRWPDVEFLSSRELTNLILK